MKGLRVNVTGLDGWAAWGFDAHGWRPRTTREYRATLARCDRWLRGRGSSLWRADTPDYLAFMSSLPATASSRQQARKALVSWGGWLVATGRRKVSPTAGLPVLRVPRRVPRPISHDHAVRVMTAATGEGPMIAAVTGLMLYSGLRFSEVRLLEWDRLDGEWVTVVGKGGHLRLLPVSPRLAGLLEGWRVQCVSPRWVVPSPLDVLRPMSETCLRGRLRPAFDRVVPHQARATFATTLVEGGHHVVTVQRLLGHVSLATTQQYVVSRTSRLREAVDGLDFAGRDCLPG
jgi:site-specific recombinase XerC